MTEKYLSPFNYIGGLIKKFEINNSFGTLENTAGLQRHLDVNHRISFINHDQDQHIIAGAITLFITVSLATEDNGKEYKVNLEIEGCFYSPEETAEEHFKQLLLNNGVATVYSIARGFIQGTTSQTLLGGSVLLPMFNVAAYSKAAEETEDDQTDE